MQKKVTIITIVLVSLLFVGAVIGLYLVASSNYNGRATKLTEDIDTAQADLDALKAAKDTNGFTPTEVVEAFFEEVKTDAKETAKLYLAPEVHDMDISATLKLGSDLSNVITGENIEEITDETADVSMTFVLGSDESTVRIFNLAKYDEAWKITGVIAR